MDGQTFFLCWTILSAVIATIGVIYEAVRRPHDDSGDPLANLVVGWIFLAIMWPVLLPLLIVITLMDVEITMGDGQHY